MINKELLFHKLVVNNFEEMIEALGSKMYAEGYVKDSYVDAVIEREKVFPTGLVMEKFNIGIPHTDSRHVEKSGIAVATLEKPIVMHSMVEPEKTVEIQLAFLMAVKDPNGQIKMLSKLMSVFQDVELLNNIQNVKDTEEMYKLLEKVNITV